MTASSTEILRRGIRSIPDFPKPGILFRDISPLLEDAALFRTTIDLLAEQCAGLTPSKIVGLDARGFIFGGALAYKLGVGFVPIRKKGKLPRVTLSIPLSWNMVQRNLKSTPTASIRVNP